MLLHGDEFARTQHGTNNGYCQDNAISWVDWSLAEQHDDLVACGSVAAAREKGLYRMEGKEYVVKDGDVLLFKFNV